MLIKGENNITFPISTEDLRKEKKTKTKNLCPVKCMCPIYKRFKLHFSRISALSKHPRHNSCRPNPSKVAGEKKQDITIISKHLF